MDAIVFIFMTPNVEEFSQRAVVCSAEISALKSRLIMVGFFRNR